jgi:hypothetical protein
LAASDPGIKSRRSQVRAWENVAIASSVIVSSQRPELEERAPDTTDLRSEGTGIGPVLAKVRVIVRKVVVKTKVTIVGSLMALSSTINRVERSSLGNSARYTLLEKYNRVVHSCLTTISPIVILIDAVVAITSTIISLTKDTVDLAEIITNGVTCSSELNLTKAVVDETTSTGLVVDVTVISVTCNNRVLLAVSTSTDVTIKIVTSGTTTSTIESAIVEHAVAIVLRLGQRSHLIGDGRLVATDITPVPVGTAILIVSSLVDATLVVENIS